MMIASCCGSWQSNNTKKLGMLSVCFWTEVLIALVYARFRDECPFCKCDINRFQQNTLR